MKKILSLLAFSMGLFLFATAQDTEGQEKKEESAVKKTKYTKATFNSTRIINMQSIEIVSPKTMQFMISHHFSYFWQKDGGASNLSQLFGLNSGLAYTYLSLDYSPNRWLNIGAAGGGRSNFEGWLKFKLLRQQTGEKNIPVSVGLFSVANWDAAKKNFEINTWNRFSFMHQLLISRKFSDKFSLQLMPTLIHFNLVPYGANNSNQVFSMGVGGKWKMSSNKNLTFEYSRQLNMYQNLIDKNGNIISYVPNLYSLGLEFNTGGHLFQLFLSTTTNSTNIDQLARNVSSLKDAQFSLGFNINRGFFLGKD